MSEIIEQLKQWPKIELHRHMEGSLRLETIAEIAREHQLDLPGHDLEALRPLVQVTEAPYTHRRFLSKFTILRHFYQSRQVIERVAYETVADAALDNVRYLELRFTPLALAKTRGFPLEQVTRWTIESIRQAEADHDIQVNLIISINRHEPVELGAKMANLALLFKDEISGLDLTGDEAAVPPQPFSGIFQQAQQAGLWITAHAGEWEGPQSIRDALEYLGATRIGHGVRSAEDADLVEELRERQIALEVCPTSNIQSGVFANPQDHPLRHLLKKGVPVSINTDDPGVSNITLTDEYAFAVRELGLSASDLKQTILGAARAAFLPEPSRDRLVSWFERALTDCDIVA